MKIVKSNIDDHIELTELTKKSKAFWGYSAEQIEIWGAELTISEEYIIENDVYQIVVDDQIIGYYAYLIIDENKAKLDNIFILPEFIGRKFGTYLMNDFFSRLRESEIDTITLDSEPNSENFYKKLGFRVVGKMETSIKNRFMSIMEMELSFNKN